MILQRGLLPATGPLGPATRQPQPRCNHTPQHARIRRQHPRWRPQRSAAGANPELPQNLPTFFDSTSADASTSSPAQQSQQPSSAPQQSVSSASSQSTSEPASQPSQAGGLRALLNPLSDPACNARLVALCSAQALCSVATLIHDTYVRPAILHGMLTDVVIILLSKVPERDMHRTTSLQLCIASVLIPGTETLRQVWHAAASVPPRCAWA